MVKQKKILETIIAKGSPDESFLWPMELIVPAKSDLYGYIMPLRPKNYKSIVDLMKKRVITIDRGMVVCDEEESGYRYED